MSTVQVSVKLSDRAVEALNELTKRSSFRRGNVISHALLLLEAVTIGVEPIPLITYLRKEYNRAS